MPSAGTAAPPRMALPALPPQAEEFRFTDEDFHGIAAILHAETGIALTPAKRSLVYSRLSKRLRLLGLPSFAAYRRLVAAEGAVERREMLSALTTNLTRFFREPHHFDHLRAHVLPAALSEARGGGRVRLWSAACSTGQEPYSLALTLLALAPDAAKLDVKILATDIDPAVLAEAVSGEYEEAALAPVPRELRARFFAPSGPERWRAGEALRRLIVFRELNLTSPSWPMRGRFAAILCRNVAIYFDQPTQDRLWERLGQSVAPGGYLYIGHSERLTGPAASAFRNTAITTYQRREAAAP